MAKLHLISQKINLEQFEIELQRVSNKDDSLLLIGEAVTCLLNKKFTQLIFDSNLVCYALAADTLCRGIEDLVPIEINQISDNKMVELTINHQNIISW